MNIAISSLAFKGLSVEEIIALCQQNDWTLEFSSSLPHREDMKELFIEAPIEKLIHNYFPAPKTPFVLNLASSNEAIRKQSIAHCKQGLRLAKQIDAPFYSAHAGFCIDPNPLELGKPISFELGFDKAEHWSLFLASVGEILKVAEELAIDFLIENNVIAPFNYKNGVNPLFCTGVEEMILLLKALDFPARIGFLLDTAHLKVSAATEGFDKNEVVNQIAPYIKCIHHSDNDGTKDTNRPLADGYWFMHYLQQFENAVHVIEVRALSPIQIQEQLTLLEGGISQ